MTRQLFFRLISLLARYTNLGIVISSLSILSACQPRDVRPGMWLRGEVLTQRVDDWSFTSDVEEIHIETHPWYGIPHSTTIWCGVFRGDLYVGSYGTDKKVWEKNVARDPQVRLGILGKLYNLVIKPVTDDVLSAELAVAYSEKYDMAEVFGNEIPKWRFYRAEQH